jgi:hypothetical protein
MRSMGGCQPMDLVINGDSSPGTEKRQMQSGDRIFDVDLELRLNSFWILDSDSWILTPGFSKWFIGFVTGKSD